MVALGLVSHPIRAIQLHWSLGHQELHQIVPAQALDLVVCHEMPTYFVHTCNERYVGRAVAVNSEQYSVTLSCREVQHACFSCLSVDSIDLDNSDGAVLKPYVHASKGSHVDL